MIKKKSHAVGYFTDLEGEKCDADFVIFQVCKCIEKEDKSLEKVALINFSKH